MVQWGLEGESIVAFCCACIPVLLTLAQVFGPTRYVETILENHDAILLCTRYMLMVAQPNLRMYRLGTFSMHRKHSAISDRSHCSYAKPRVRRPGIWKMEEDNY